jgi:AcrR family transcriptional regulator
MLDDASSVHDPSAGRVDKRLIRGQKSRGRVLDRAVDVASERGLDGLSFGTLAADLGVSKAGIQTLFRSKEALQLAVIERADELFAGAVIDPSQAAPRGLARLSALLDRWVRYADEPLFEGGCFWSANLATFDSQPGPVHDALFVRHQRWIHLLADELRCAVDRGELGDLDVDATAFELAAVLLATNVALRAGDADAIPRMRRIVDGVLAAAV